MKRIIFAVILFLASFWGAFGQTVIWSEDFSSSANYSVTLGGEGSDGTADYFQRTDGTDINKSYTGNSNDFFAAQDIDDGGWTGSANPSELTWTGINISGYTSLSFEGLFASIATAKIDDNDYVKVEINIDGGGWTTILEFENDGTQYNTYFLEDTDFDGTGDGTQLTSTFSSFTKTISGTGSSMDLKITVAVNSGDEDIAFDEFYIKGTDPNAPILSVSSSSLSGYSYIFSNGPSSSQSFDLSGTNLDGDTVIITAPTNYEVSTDNSSFGIKDTISYSGSTLNATTIYVRLKAGLSVGTYNSELVTCSDNGTASDVTVSNDGEVYESILSVSPSSLTGYSYIFSDGPSSSQSFDLSGTNLDGDTVIITAPTNYEVSTDNSSFGTKDTISYSGSTLNATTIYVRLKAGLSVGTYNSELVTCEDNGHASNVTVSNDGEVYESIITVSPTSITGLDYIAGAGPSTEQSYSLSGTNLLPASGDISVTAPTNFEIATSSGGTYSSSLTISYTGNNLSATDIYVRLVSGLSVGTYGASNITNSGGNATTQNVSVSGEVTNPTVNFSVTSASVSENGTSYTINVTSNTIWSHTVDIIVNGGTATNGSEYTFTSPITADFSTSTTFSTTVTINDDATCNGNTNVIFELNNNSGCDIGSSNQLDLTIDDDEMENGEYLAARFEGSDTWGYSADGSIQNDFDKYNDGNSYRLEYSNSITFDDVNITGFTDVKISVAYASDGTDSGEDLYMSVSYDGGSTYTDYELIDGYSNYSLDINQTGISDRTPQGVNPFVLSIPSSETSVKVKFWTTGIDAGEYFYVDDIIMTRTSCNVCSEPTSDASFDSGSPSSLDGITATLDWTSGDGQNRIVVMREDLSVAFTPSDNSTYVANSSFGSGTDVGTNEYVVYNGSSNTVDVTNLTPGTEYFTKIYEYSCNAGSEDYYTSGTPTVDTFITIPNNPDWNDAGCSTNSTIDLSWTAATGNSTGYLLVVREGAIPHAITSLDPGTNLGEDLDYSNAATFGSTTPYSRILYKGTGTNVTVTGLTQGTSYTFKLYTYTVGSSDYVYSSGTQQTNLINVPDVSSEASTCGDTESDIAWANPTSSCFDEVLVVANETSGIDFSPSGDGSSYTVNTDYSAGADAVYRGTGTSVNVTNLTNGTTYYFEIFVRKGTEWSPGVEVSCTPNVSAILYSGDLAIVAINTHIYDSANPSDDEVCFFAFKDITTGTAIDFTDNGYEKLNVGEWGETEGTIRLERTGGTIEKGTVICIQGNGSGSNSGDFSIFVCGVNDDANWNISSLNGTGPFDLNINDQIWIMQGGNWTNPGGTDDCTYDGSILYGWTAVGWEPSAGYDNTQGSTLYDGAHCFNTDVAATSYEDKVKFYSDTAQILSQAAWIGEINSTGNWTGYPDSINYFDNGLNYSGSCIKFHIDNSLGNGAGRWQGGENNNWFNCANWLNMTVPDETIDVTILSNAENEVNIDDAQDDADLFGYVAKCKNLTVEDGGDTVYIKIDDSNDELQVKEKMTLEANSKVYNDNGGTISVDGDIEINDGALLDMHANTTSGSTLNLKGNWIDYNTTDDNTQGFYETDSKVIFMGTSSQTISDATGNETFYDLQMNNASGLDLNSNDLTIAGTLDLSLGDITTGSNNVIIANTATGSIINSSTSSYVNGNLRRSVLSSGSYDFPVGTDAQYELANINLNSSSGITYFDSKFTNPVGTTDISSLGLTINSTPVTTLLDYGYWTITPDAYTTVDYDVTITSTGHTNGGSIATQHTIVKREDDTQDWAVYEANHDNSTQSGMGTNPITAKLTGLTSFSDFAIARSDINPLPITLLSFNAKPKGKFVELNWVTQSEINNDYFTVEKSYDGIMFFEVLTVAGNGTTNHLNSYSAQDYKLQGQTIYYRLKQTDFDGNYSYSKIISVELGINNLDISFYNNTLEFKLDKDLQNHIRIVDELGRIYFDKNISNQENLKLEISNFDKGIYIVSCQNKYGVITKKIVK